MRSPALLKTTTLIDSTVPVASWKLASTGLNLEVTKDSPEEKLMVKFSARASFGHTWSRFWVFKIIKMYPLSLVWFSVWFTMLKERVLSSPFELNLKVLRSRSGVFEMSFLPILSEKRESLLTSWEGVLNFFMSLLFSSFSWESFPSSKLFSFWRVWIISGTRFCEILWICLK